MYTGVQHMTSAVKWVRVELPALNRSGDAVFPIVALGTLNRIAKTMRCSISKTNVASGAKLRDISDVYCTVHHCNSWRMKDQLDVTCYFVSLLMAEACNMGTTQTQPHQISNTQWTENKTTDVVIQQQSRKLLMMDILMSETCWAHKKWNKIASDIKLVFHSSTVHDISFL